MYIIGALGYPGFHYPGYAVVVGIDRKKHPGYEKKLEVPHIIRALEEVEKSNIQELIKACIQLQAKYAAHPVMDRLWFADLDEAQENRAMAAIRRAGKGLYSFCPGKGPFFENPTPWKTYFDLLREYAPVLDRRGCPKLRSYMAAGPKNLKEVMAFKPEKNPALAAIAVAVAQLVDSKPWFWEAEGLAFNLED